MAISLNMTCEVRTTGSDTACSGLCRSGAAIAAPSSAPTCNGSSSGGTIAAGTYYIVITFIDQWGETVASSQTSVVTTGTTSSITVTAPTRPTGALLWQVYAGTVSGGPYYQSASAVYQNLPFGTNIVIIATPPTSAGSSNPAAVKTNYSLQDAAQVAVDGATITATIQATTTRVVLVGYTVVAADIGNSFYATGGTGTTGMYEIIDINVASNYWVLDRSAGTSTQTLTGNVGGALASPGGFGLVKTSVSGVSCWVKAGTYTMSTTSNVAAGRLTMDVAGADGTRYTYICGYNSTRGDFGTKPVLIPGANSTDLITVSQTQIHVENFEFQSNSKTTVQGILISSGGGRSKVRRCTFTSLACNGGGAIQVATAANVQIFDCYFSGSSSGNGSVYINAATNGVVQGCVVNGGSITGFYGASPTGYTFDRCVAISVTGSSNGFAIQTNARNNRFVNCTVYHDAATNSAGNAPYRLEGIDCIADNCLAYINQASSFAFYNSTVTQKSIVIRNCAVYAAAGGTVYGCAEEGLVTLTGNPFTNAGSGDVSLDATTGEGAACRGAGLYGSFPGALFTGHLDIGAVQHGDPASGGVTMARVRTGM